VVEVTEVRPAMVVAVSPRLTAVEPIVMLELFNAPLGMLVRLAPDPLNTVADNVPVEGTYLYLVELVYSVDKVPLVTDANNGYRMAAVVVSSEMVIADVGVVHVGAPEALDVKT
jgi:hypothetical protein